MVRRKNMNHSCSFCGFKATLKSLLQDHIRKHTRERPFICQKCKREFSCKGNLSKHIRKLHPDGPPTVYKKIYKCSLCPYAAHTKHYLERHIRRHTGERSFPCQHPHCEYAAKSSQALKAHINGKHTSVRNFLCRFPNCGYRGKSKASVNKHSLTHSECLPFSCDFEGCNYRAKIQERLKTHQRGVHNDGFKPFACSICNHRTTSKIRLRNHVIAHSEEKPFKCHLGGCAYTCKFKRHLSQHILNQHEQRKFKCDFVGCSSTSATQFMLEKHKKLVHCEKIYNCPLCDYRAATSSQLWKHQNRHNPSQKIPCPHKGCPIRFKNQESLKSHMKNHQTNLSCLVDGCGYVGISKSGLRRHMRIHDSIGRPFHCPLCPKKFSKNYILTKHLKIHTGEKPFKCPACNYDSVSKGNVMRHVRLMHSSISPGFSFDEKYTCDHCHVNFGCAVGLTMHSLTVKTAVVVLTRLQFKLDQ